MFNWIFRPLAEKLENRLVDESNQLQGVESLFEMYITNTDKSTQSMELNTLETLTEGLKGIKEGSIINFKTSKGYEVNITRKNGKLQVM